MANAYLTEQEIRDALPDGIRAATTKYNALMRQLAERVSRYIDQYCRQKFFPTLEVRYFDGSGKPEQWIDDIVGIPIAPTISVSNDNGATYTALVPADYILTRAGDYNTLKTYNMLIMNESTGNYSSFYEGQRSIKITGVWSHHDDQINAWEDSLDEVENAPSIGVGVTGLIVNDADGPTAWGYTPRFAVGQLIRMHVEFCEIGAVNTGTNTLTIVRGRNGTTDAIHLQNIQIDIWRPPHPVKMAAIIQAVRQMERGFQGFGDARATPEIGQLFYMKAMDPEAQALLAPFRKSAVG